MAGLPHLEAIRATLECVDVNGADWKGESRYYSIDSGPSSLEKDTV